MNKALYNKFIVLLTSKLLQTNKSHGGRSQRHYRDRCHMPR
jgi:hypothetical protein